MKNKKKKQVKAKVKAKANIKKKAPTKKTSKASKKAVKKAVKRSIPKQKKKKVITKKSVAKKISKPLKKVAVKIKSKAKAKPIKPVKAAKSIKPTKPAKAAKPVKPLKAAKPVKPVKAAKPAKAFKEPIVKQVKKCKKSLCKELAFANGYCRYHYIASWKAEHIDKKVRKIKHLEKLIIEIKKRFPNQYLDLIKGDLMSDKIFRQVLKDMDLEEDISDFEISDDTQKILDSYSVLVDTDNNEEEF